jgi:hypothetical protein
MNLEKMPEVQSARMGLFIGDKVSKDGAPADNKKGLGRTILYARVSTAEQTLAHQKAQACPPSALVGQIRQIEEGSVSGSS